MSIWFMTILGTLAEPDDIDDIECATDIDTQMTIWIVTILGTLSCRTR